MMACACYGCEAMIVGLDHVAVAVVDLDAAVDIYRRLLGVEPDFEDGAGARRAWFRFPNMALELIAPDGEGAAGDRVRAQLDASGEGVWAMAFAVQDLEAATRLFTRRGLRAAPLPAPAVAVSCERADAAGLQIFLRAATPRRLSPATGAAPVAGLDHVVISTPNADRALAIYGARLGLDLRLDRSNASWGARQLFFKAGDAVVEFGASLKAPVTNEPDRFGGLAWRVADPHAVHARLAAAGFNVSEIRTGRKPGTHVFTVRDAPCGVPTLMLSAEPPSEDG
jgi:catechol 2,3-dioxygenase-like lactoylglutathione lyase family enzyme